MKKFLLSLTAASMIFAGCSNEQKSIPEVKGDALRVTNVEAEASEESKAEIEKIGQDGFRLMEYDAEKLLQQSVWKNNAGTWTPESDIQPVNGGHIVAVYPAGEVQEGNERIFKAGVNNMYSVQDVDRDKTNEAAVVFKHAMCQIELNVVDQNGKAIHFGTGNGMITSVKLTQPLEVKYDICEGQPIELGAMQEMDFNMAAAYVVPGGKDYKFNVVYTNKEGRENLYTHTFEEEIVRNKKYVANLKMDTEEESVLGVSVSVEEWDVEEMNIELIKEEEEEAEIKFITNKDIGSNISIDMSSDDFFTIDWGNGELKKYEAGVYHYDKALTEKTKGKTIRITGKCIKDILLQNQKITSIEFNHCKELKEVRLFYNMITSIDMSQCENLEFLNIASNKLENLSLDKNTKLKELHCYKNNINSITLPKSIELLYAYRNQFEKINLNTYKNLKYLNLYRNKISALDISSLDKLIELNLSKNDMSELKLSNSPSAILSVSLKSNQLNNEIINTIIKVLPDVNGEEVNEDDVYWKLILDITGNPDAKNCDWKTAEKKGWKVKY